MSELLQASPATPTRNFTILIVDDIPANVGALGGALELAGYRVLSALSGPAALKAAIKARPDLILLDVLMPGIDGIETCRRLKGEAATSEIPVIFVTANDETTSLVQGFEAGGIDYITKPFRIDEVLARVQTQLRMHQFARDLAARTAELEEANRELRAEICRRQEAEEALERADGKLSLFTEAEGRQWGVDGLVGRSDLFRKMLQAVRRVQEFPRTNVLITGESGTGKELVARAIHLGGPRAGTPFVAVNCSALPAEQAESLLFGHLQGAFAGALADRKGYFEHADGGTLFLDGIGDMALALQSRLLRVIEDGEVLPVGEETPRTVSVRVIAATHVDLPQKVAAGDFREDLYHRLMRYQVQVPPLRERLEDVPALARHFVRHFAAELKCPASKLGPEVLQRLITHRYPGNIRELKNTIERALIHASGGRIEVDHVLFAPGPGAPVVPASGDARLSDLPLNLAEAEERLIDRALVIAEGNVSAAARLLGVNRARLYRRRSAARRE